MRFGLIFSVVVHVSILLAAIIVLPKPNELVPQVQESIPVEIVEFTGKSQQVATKKDAKPLPKDKVPLPPKVEKVGKAKPVPKPEPIVKKAAVEPEPEPKPEPVKKQPEPDPLKELIKKAEKLPEPIIEPAPKKEPEPKKVEAETSPLPVPRSKPKVPKKFVEAQKKKKKKRKLDLNKLSALLNKIDEKTAERPQEG